MLLQKDMFAQQMKLVCQFDVDTGVTVSVDKHRVTDLVVYRLIMQHTVPSRNMQNPLWKYVFLWRL